MPGGIVRHQTQEGYSVVVVVVVIHMRTDYMCCHNWIAYEFFE